MSAWAGLAEALENDTTGAATWSMLVLPAIVSSEGRITSLLFLNLRRNKLPEKIKSNVDGPCYISGSPEQGC